MHGAVHTCAQVIRSLGRQGPHWFIYSASLLLAVPLLLQGQAPGPS